MNYELHTGDSIEILKTLSAQSIDCIITSPPYFNLRPKTILGQLGTETSLAEYICNLEIVFSECKRILKNTGLLYVIIGDTWRKKEQLGWTHSLGIELSPEYNALGQARLAHLTK